MPTVKPRYTFTDTGKLEDLLDLAARRWPEVEDRKQLLLKLAKTGAERIDDEKSARLRAIEETAGIFTGMYPPGALAELREDWPD